MVLASKVVGHVLVGFSWSFGKDDTSPSWVPSSSVGPRKPPLVLPGPPVSESTSFGFRSPLFKHLRTGSTGYPPWSHLSSPRRSTSGKGGSNLREKSTIFTIRGVCECTLPDTSLPTDVPETVLGDTHRLTVLTVITTPQR